MSNSKFQLCRMKVVGALAIIMIATFVVIQPANASVRKCNLLVGKTDQPQVVNPAVMAKLANYNGFEGDKEFSKLYKKLVSLGQKDISSLSEKDLENIQQLVAKLDEFFLDSTLDESNTDKKIELNSVEKNNEIEKLTLEKLESEKQFYVYKRQGSEAIVVFSAKLINSINKKSVYYLSTMVEAVQMGIVDYGKGISRLLDLGDMKFPTYEVREVSKEFGGYRTYGAEVDQLADGTPIIYFFVFRKEHIVGNGKIEKQLRKMLKKLPEFK